MDVEDGEVESVAALVDCELESVLDVLLDGEVLYIPALELLELGEAEEDWFQADESVVAFVLVFAAVEELV